MGKVFGLILIVIGIYVGMTVYDEGVENAFGGIFAPIDGDAIKGTEDPYAAPAGDRAPITDRVRERVQAHMERGEARSSRY